MKYERVEKAEFLLRENRFVAKVIKGGKEETVHVKNTGRCKELLVPGATVYLSVSDNPGRKTKYDLVAVEKKREGRETLLINMDSSAPNDAVSEWLEKSGLFPDGAVIRREVTKGKSRFDFAVEYQNTVSYVEVKGVTLEENGRVMFPDAPTERGVKHVNELCSLVKGGIKCFVIFKLEVMITM